jgi:chemotaxis signal transduction protein
MNTSELLTDADAWLIGENFADVEDRDVQTYAQTYMLARLERFTFVFPSAIIADIVIFSQSQVLAVPFYNPACLGVVHYNGQIVPLVSLRQIFGMSMTGIARSNLTVVRLSSAAEDLADLGLVVDAVLGSSSHDRLPSNLFTADRSLSTTDGELDGDRNMRLFHPEILDSQLWQPQRWLKAKSNQT